MAFIEWFMDLLSRFLGWPTDLPQAPTSPVVPSLPPNPPSMTNAEKVVASAKKFLGQNLSVGTGVPSYVACAISVNKVVTDSLGEPAGGGASTLALYQALLKNPKWKEVNMPLPGSILVSPTGYGTNETYPHGHTGIVGNFGICSNDSASGLWLENYADYNVWKAQFEITEGYPTFIFAPVEGV